VLWQDVSRHDALHRQLTVIPCVGVLGFAVWLARCRCSWRVRAELGVPVCAFLAPFGSRVVAFPGHF